MDSKYEGMYRLKQKKNKENSNSETKHSSRRNTCYPESITSRRKDEGFCSACCSKTSAIFFAFLLFLDGALLAVGHYSLQKTTTSLEHVQHHIPNYVTAAMVSEIFDSFFRPQCFD